jgi:outer membrane protein assembly factor BamA
VFSEPFVAPLVIVVLLLGNTQPPQSQAQPAEIVTEVRIQGNLATPDEEVLRLAGVVIGMPVGPDTVETITDRLRATKRFEHVEVLKRYASISDPTRITLVLLIDEGPVDIQTTGDPNEPTRVVRRRGLKLQLLPVLYGEDGYGLTYGVRVSRSDVLGRDSRVSFPATWGGEKRAAIEVAKGFDHGLVPRVGAGVSVSRTTNPFYREDDDRLTGWVRGERTVAPALRIGASASWQRVSFLGVTDRERQIGVDAVLDTRLDPWLARNAIYLKAGWDHLAFDNSAAANRSLVDAQGYVGLVGQSILVIRLLHEGSDRPLPPYLRPLLGGSANLRGFRAGTDEGDDLIAGSIELRVPLTSPFSIGKMGVNGFVDAGTVYNDGERLSDQPIERGIGAGVWFTAAIVKVNVAVAHGMGASTRGHFRASLSF